MRVNFNGMRKNATSNINALQKVIIEMMSRYDLYYGDEEELIKAFDDVANSIDSFNMLEDKERGIKELSYLQVKRLGEND